MAREWVRGSRRRVCLDGYLHSNWFYWLNYFGLKRKFLESRKILSFWKFLSFLSLIATRRFYQWGKFVIFKFFFFFLNRPQTRCSRISTNHLISPCILHILWGVSSNWGFSNALSVVRSRCELLFFIFLIKLTLFFYLNLLLL